MIRHADGVRIEAPPSRAAARGLLDIPRDDPVFVCPGFIHPDKGFDRAVAAFRDGGIQGRLYIVGSVKDAIPANVAHLRLLRQLVAATPGVELVERFVDDAEFDAWIAAADAVLLPYRRSWSSGVLARAQALGTPVIAIGVGGIGEQASIHDVVVADDQELEKALVQLVQEREVLR